MKKIIWDDARKTNVRIVNILECKIHGRKTAGK